MYAYGQVLRCRAIAAAVATHEPLFYPGLRLHREGEYCQPKKLGCLRPTRLAPCCYVPLYSNLWRQKFKTIHCCLIRAVLSKISIFSVELS
jgi:hypothetical protein